VELNEYLETRARLEAQHGKTMAQWMVDQLDADRIKANRKEAKRLAKENLIREIIRKELSK
jgi:hypothetical protein